MSEDREGRPERILRKIQSVKTCCRDLAVHQWAAGTLCTVGAGIGLSVAFRLTTAFALLLVFGMFALLPGILVYEKRYRREQERFLEISIYMEQILYAFKGTQKILNALEDVLFLFPEGRMHQSVSDGIRLIERRTDKGQAERLALRQIERAYPCEQLCRLHRFLLHVEQYGGDFSDGVDLMLRECHLFAERAEKQTEQRKKCRREIDLSVLLSTGICLFSQYMLPGRTDISRYDVTAWTSVLLLLGNLFLLLLSSRQLSGNLFQNALPDAYALKKYAECKKYRRERAEVQSFYISLFPFGAAVLLAVVGGKRAAFFCAAAGMLLLFQHRAGHALALRMVKRELSRAFPQWLMQMGLLLQTENVQVAIARSERTAPLILQPAIRQMVQELEYQPESEEPFLAFLKEFQMGEVSSAMRMLYSLSAGTGGSAGEQISALVRKIQNGYDRAKRRENEDKLAGMYVLFLAPAVIGMFKLAADMSVFVMAYFTALTV